MTLKFKGHTWGEDRTVLTPPCKEPFSKANISED